MKFISFIIVLGVQIISSNACCSEGSTVIQIKNYEGPIYLHAPQTACEDKVHISICDFDDTCVSKPSYFPSNTATASTLYTYPTLYQDTKCTPGSYNVPLYQDCPVIVPHSTFCSAPQDDCSYVCGKCGKRF